MGGGDPGRADI